MSIVHIDFETRSNVDIRVCGAGRYAADDSTRILCVCWAVDNGKVFGSVGESIPAIFKQGIKEGWQFSAFNAMFEQLIWKYRWPNLPLPQFICTRALVASHGLPQALNRACKSLHIGIAKDKEGVRLINVYSKPKKEGGFNELKGEDETKMLQYCAKDVILSRRIMQRVPALPEFEQKLYDWTVKANLRGITIDSELAAKAETIATTLQEQGNTELVELTNNKIFAVTQVQRIKTYLKDEFGIEAECLDKEAIGELLLMEALPDRARRILELRRDLSQTSVKKFKRALLSVCPDGKVRDILIYFGAGTGRWASQAVQFHNLPRHTVSDPQAAMNLISHGDPELFDMCYKSPMLALSACIRGLVVPEPGKKLAIVDYNAIEARMLMWYAGQEDAVDDFRRGRDIYIEMAQHIYQNKNLTKKNKIERTVAKHTVLGCGYQMGYIKFQATCEGFGVDLGEKTECHERVDSDGKLIKTWYSPLARRAVESYRQRFYKVPMFWRGMQQAAELCVKTEKAYKFRAFTFYREREYLYMALPSGRNLAYHRPGYDNNGLYYYTEDSQTRTYVKKRTYGGKLVENAIQALARDILAYGIINLEEAGHEVILTVHDENVLPIQEDDQLDEISDIMCDLPEWAKGCPITAEGFIAERYRKG